ncbi:MAG TPA: tetratricopeptide repeat protein [Pseudonocardiaceae bacterium]|jgi:serine/threonine-protein kinase PknG|nr:tetratricopeptide repeat protein [Pseudonocardiaceae bacterium]
MTACARPGCTGTIQDGFCDVCGLAPAASAATPAGGGSTPSRGTSGRTSATTGASGMSGMSGTVAAGPTSSRSTATRASSSTGPLSGPGTARGSRGTSSRSGRSSRRGLLGAGLVEVPPVPYRDPASAVMTNPEVAERKRFCGNCGDPVGRGRDGRPGRTEGFCRKCGTGYSFAPKLVAGDLAGNQYEVLGCLAHGGLGWVYLARDRNVNDRWVVLKGLLDTGDSEAMAAAVAERRFLAEVEHPSIVKIYNFVQHPDPRTGTMVGYIVMEYVGGQSLKELRSVRDASGQLVPMPVGQAIAYALEVLPALGYLHGLNLLYCDFKPDNVIQSEEQLKLIDLGAVRRFDDDESPMYKTDGYCAPELATEGPSASSDLYTVGRTLAVLTVNFDYSGKYREQLPDLIDVPVFGRHGSYWRVLLRATDPDPDRRFGSAQDMVEQLTGVLREVMSTEDGRQRPALSTLFSPERKVFGADPDSWPAAPTGPELAAALPVPQVDTADPAAGLLATSAATEPGEVLRTLSAAPLATLEVRLRTVRARIELGDLAGASADLAELDQTAPGDWRVTWYRGLAALAGGDPVAAAAEFTVVHNTLPGEAAGKLALAVSEELRGNRATAAKYYELVWRTDHGYLSAAFGLARVRLAEHDRAAALAVLDSVPASSSHHLPAQLAAITAGTHTATPAELAERDLVGASGRLEALTLDLERRNRLAIGLLEAANAWVLAGSPGSSGRATGPAVLGCALTERELRFGLERSYRALARLADTPGQRIALVDRANAVRPATWV